MRCLVNVDSTQGMYSTPLTKKRKNYRRQISTIYPLRKGNPPLRGFMPEICGSACPSPAHLSDRTARIAGPNPSPPRRANKSA